MKSVFRSPLVNVLLFSIFWALVIFTSKLAFLSGAQLVPFSLQSAFLTFLFLSIYIFFTRTKELKKISWQTLKKILIINAIYMGVGSFFSYAGVQLTTAINAGFLSQFTTVSGIILAWLLLKEKMTSLKIVSLIAIVIGSFLLSTKGQLIIPHIGDLLIIIATIAWGLGGVLIRKLLKHSSINPDVVSFFRPIAGIPVILLFMLLSPLYPPSLRVVFQVNIFSIHQIQYVILNAICLSLDWIFVNRTLKIASASYAGIMPSITPILVAVLSVFFLKEHIVLIQYIGIILILASSTLAQYTRVDKH